MMRSVLVTVAFLAVFALAVPTAWAGMPICPLQDVTATAPCGKIISAGYSDGRDCIGAAGCPAGKSCVPIPEESPSTTTPLMDNFTGANCVGAQENAAEEESNLPDPVTFTPNVELPGFPTTTKVSGRTAGQYIRALYIYFVGVVGVLAVAMIMYAGFLWITAAGNATRVTQAKEQMNAAVIGLILTLTSFLLLQLINPELVKLKDFNLPTVPRILQPIERQQSPEKGAPPVSFDASKMGNLDAYDAMFLKIACKPPYSDRDLAFRWKAIMTIESSGRKDIISSANAVGLMQLLPSTANKTITELQDPETNIAAGAAHVKQLRANTCPSTALLKIDPKTGKRPPAVDCDGQWLKAGSKSCVNGDWKYIAAAYNGGAGANCASVDCPGKTWWECPSNWTGPDSFEQTYIYVQKFQAAYKVLTDKNWLPNCP